MWQEKYDAWRCHAGLNAELKKELERLSADDAKERFYSDLVFGTGGLRGRMGVGSNRMNLHTVDQASRGLAAYLKSAFPAPSCAIAYDSRHQSSDFAKIAAAALAAAGVRAHLFPQLMPTPMLSFAVRYLGCSGGIVITASHNPAEYNGYKVYGSDGCQITLEAAEAISGFIGREPMFTANLPDYREQCARGYILPIGSEVTEVYYQRIADLSVCPVQTPLHVVYSPLNGTGNVPVREVLKRMGGVTVTVVAKQEAPDGSFPTCPYPNPEMKEAMQLACECMQAEHADFCLATDPDCDRVGVGVPGPHGAELVTGNEIGVMLLDFICARRSEAGRMPDHPVAVKTIVTTGMAGAVCRRYGVELRNVLTGFKFIGEQIALLEAQGHVERYLFGFEESYGYLSGHDVRDKDAVNACLLICEMASYYKGKGLTLLAVRDRMSAEYGFYLHELLSFLFEGIQGKAQMAALMVDLRRPGLENLYGLAIQQRIDYQHDETGLPKSDVISFQLEGNAEVVVRPSGTEPKLKIYLTVHDEDVSKCRQQLSLLAEHLSHAFTSRAQA